MNPDWKLKAEFLEFSDWMPNVTKKAKITHNIYWRNWKKRVILTMIRKIMKCVWEECGNKFGFGHDGFAMLKIQLQRMDLWFDWFFWEEFWSRDSIGSCQCLKVFNTRRSAETTAPSCRLRLFFLEIFSLFLLGVTIFISLKKRRKKKKRKERTWKEGPGRIWLCI